MIFSFFWRGAPSDLPACPVAAAHFKGVTCLDRPQLGEGASAKAFVVQRLVEGAEPVEAVLKVQKIDTRERKAAVERERDVLLQARHPNLVELFDWKFEAPFAFLLMEFGSEGTLRSYMETHEQLFADPLAVLALFRTLVEAADYMHSRLGLVHADIKDTNVVVVRDGSLRLIDFDLAVKFGSYDSGHGTAGWMDPQFYRAEEDSDLFLYDDKVDVFSLGVVLYQMFHAGELPFGRGYEYRRKLRDGNFVVRKGVPLQVVFILNACLQTEPSSRPSVEKLLRLLAALPDAQSLKLAKEDLTQSNWQGPGAEVERAMENSLAKADVTAYMTRKVIV